MATLQEILAPIGAEVADHHRQMDSVRMAIEYEAHAAMPDEVQLGYLYEKIDGMQTAAVEASDLIDRLLESGESDPFVIQREVHAILSGKEPNGWQQFLHSVGVAIRDAMQKLVRAFASMFQKLKWAARNAWATLRRFFKPAKRPLSRRKRPAPSSPLEPLPLAFEQAPGACSGVIRAEVRYYRRFL